MCTILEMLLLVKGFVLSYNSLMRLEQTVAQQLIKKRKTLAVAESCSGGLLTHRLTNIPGASRFLRASIIAYSNAAKLMWLKVPQETIRACGAVSAETAVLMARNVRQIHHTDFGIAITGIAGPTGGTKTKPVGLTFIAVDAPPKTLCLRCRFRGKRTTVKSKAVSRALRLLAKLLHPKR